MSTILHLTDLHLGKDPVLGDYKADILPDRDRVTLHRHLPATLSRLAQYLKKADIPLDALVISGDITIAGQENGYQELEKLLENLGVARPKPDKTVVVPGNHDVAWKTIPGTAARYDLFLQYIRKAGYVTPFLEGVDDLNRAFKPEEHFVFGPGNQWVIVPINSSNYCGSLSGLADVNEADLQKLADPIKAFIDTLRLHDVARISLDQVDALARILESAKFKAQRASIVAVLHHHLLPVSTSEEFKSFESITNLGYFREFLRKHRVDVVLHGHKHVGLTYWDQIPDLDEKDPAHRVLVISGTTMGGFGHQSDEVARLIQFEGHPDAPAVTINKVALNEVNAAVDEFKSNRWRLWEGRPTGKYQDPGVQFVSGATAEEVYERCLDLFCGERRLQNVVCQVGDGASAMHLPHNYPRIEGVEEAKREEWFADIVKWWQRDRTKLLKRLNFTHGIRICDYDDGDPKINQFDRVLAELRRDGESGRAIAVLLRPTTDDVTRNYPKFPAFCTVQFVICNGADHAPRLDCIGYFRKQEIRYWLPVNLAELAMLQKEAVKMLSTDYSGLAAGQLTTIAAIAVRDGAPARVALPLVDKLFDDESESLWSMVYAVFSKDIPNRKTYVGEWNRILDNLDPTGQATGSPSLDGVPVALEGLRFLADTVSWFLRHHTKKTKAAELEDQLNSLYDANESFFKVMGAARDSKKNRSEYNSEYEKWQKKVTKTVARIREIIHNLLL